MAVWSGETYLNYSWILFAALYEFVISKLCVLVPIHVCEDLVYALGRQGQVGRDRKGRETFSGVSSSAGGFTICPVIL